MGDKVHFIAAVLGLLYWWNLKNSEFNAVRVIAWLNLICSIVTFTSLALVYV